MNGYTGKWVVADLSRGLVEVREMDQEFCRRWVGGSLMAARLFWELGGCKHDAFAPGNPLIIAAGALAGAAVSGASRFEILTRSPLTGGIAEASSGGNLAPQLKFAGFDGVIVVGQSEKPVYLWITDGGAELRDAERLWGVNTTPAVEQIKEELGEKGLQAAVIGPAGENLVKYACVVAGPSDVAGRSGIGAVMGAKKLKAVAIRGRGKFQPADPEAYKSLQARLKDQVAADITCQTYTEFGTAGMMNLGMTVTDVPTKNWRMAHWWEGAESLSGVRIADTIMVKRRSCFGCIVGCKRVVKSEFGPFAVQGEVAGPEYETCASLGTMLMNKNLESLVKANELCNEYGMDSISCGGTIAWAMEAFEKGILTEEEIGRPLDWGDPEAIVEMVERIAHRRGIGDLLAEGSRIASIKVGKGSDRFAIHVRGQELPMHDPRAFHGLAVAYATSPRGACHMRNHNIVLEMNAVKSPEADLRGNFSGIKDLGKGHMTAKGEDWAWAEHNIPICIFPGWAYSLPDLAEMMRMATGMDWTPEELLLGGRRAWYLMHSMNLLMGMDWKDARIPKRAVSAHEEGRSNGLDRIVGMMLSTMTKLPKPKNEALRKLNKKMNIMTVRIIKKLFSTMGALLFFLRLGPKGLEKKLNPDYDLMMKEYCEHRRLDERGLPASGVLAEIGLEDVDAALQSLR